MNAILYLQLPLAYEDVDEIENIASVLFESLTTFPKEITIFYDAPSIRTFLENHDEFQDYVSSNATHIEVQEHLLNRSQSWEKPKYQQSDCRYIHWDWHRGGEEVTGKPLAEIAERLLLNHASHFIFLNIGNTQAQRKIAPVIKDALHDKELPKIVCVEQVADYQEFEQWWAIKQADTPITFTLRDTSKFERTNFFRSASKQSIYKEISTGNYWYFDYYHKDNKIHYEVFNSTGKVHLGEADENGNLNSAKADGQKKIDYIIG